MKWLKESLTDNDGIYDVAYVSLFMVMAAVFGAILTMTGMSVYAYTNCVEIIKDIVLVRSCVYDAQNLGMAIGAACGGFATALAALAGYMAATKRREDHGSSPTTTP